MSIAPHTGIVDFGTFTAPTASTDGIQGEVPQPLAGQEGYVLTGTGWASAGSVGLVGYQGTWNALTNTPTLTSSVGTQGYYYVVDVAGTTNLNGITDWQVGDWAIFNGSIWQKVDNTDSYDPANVAITGGTINNTTIGATTPAAGTFTTLTAQNETLKGTGQNLAVRSQQINLWGVVGSPTLTGNASTAPDGTTTATQIAFTTSGNGVYIFPVLVSGATATYSLYVKNVTTANSVRIGCDFNPATATVVVDATTGTITSVGASITSSSITSVGSGWYRVVFSFVATSSSISSFVIYNNSGTSQTLLAWGAQAEISPTVGTYVPTTTTAVYGTPTLSFSGVASIGLQSDGSLYETSAGTGNVRFYTNNIAQEQMRVSHTASAVNYHQLTGSATGSGPIHSVAGSDTNIDLNLTPKGTGSVINNVNGGTFTIGRESASNSIKLTAPNQNLYIQSTGGGSILFNTADTILNQMRITSTTAAVNYANITGGATGSGVTLSAQGSDTNIDLNATAKGTGSVNLNSGTVTVAKFLYENSTDTSFWKFRSRAGDGFNIGVVADGTASNIGFNISTKGTAASRFFTGDTGGFTAGVEQFRVAHTTSAVNFVQITGAAAGATPTISVQGSDSANGLVFLAKGGGGHYMKAGGGTYFSNLGSNLQFAALSNGTSVNYATVIGGSTGAGPIHSVVGSDTNIDINFTTKGTGNVNLNTGNGLQFRAESSAATATDYVLVGGSNFGRPFIRSAATSGNIDLAVSSQGTGAVRLYTNFVGQEQVRVSHTASAVNYLQATGGATGSGVTLSAQGSDTNIDINLVPKGTGSTVYTGGVTINGTLTAQNETINGTGMNLVLYSQNYSFWNPNALTVTANSTTAPDATNTASLLTANGSATQHYIFQAGTAGTINSFYPRTFSIYLKAGTNNFAQVLYGSDVNAYANFDLSTGALGTVGSTVTATITSAGSGWYRCSVTTSSSLAAQNVYILIASGTSAARFESNSLSTTIYSWGAQFEYGSTVRPYLVTTGSVVYNTPQLQFNNSGILQFQADGSVVVQPAGTGALQAQATTSTAAGGNARGSNAVDLQTLRDTSIKVASGPTSVVAGGQANYASSFWGVVSGGYNNGNTSFGGVLAGGYQNATAGNYSVSSGGRFNTSGGSAFMVGSVSVGGISNSSLGTYNFIGGGFTNSGTSSSAVTTQSATMNGTTAVTLSGSNASIRVGQYITGTSIGEDTYVAAISGTSLTLSKVASGSSTSTLSFFTPHGVVVGGGNNQATGSYSFIGGGGDAGTAANRNVASGDYSVVVGGRSGTASGTGSFVGGGGYFGIQNTYPNTASGTASVVVGGLRNVASGEGAFVGSGDNNIANANYSSIAGGNLGSARSIRGYAVFPACQYPLSANLGVSQSALLILAKQTTDATATVLVSDNTTASGINQVILPNNSAYYFKGSVIANVTGAANGAAWDFTGAIMRGANAASTVLMGTPAINRVAATAGATAWAIAITADTTNGGLAVTVTGAASTTIRWVCKAETTEVTF